MGPSPCLTNGGHLSWVDAQRPIDEPSHSANAGRSGSCARLTGYGGYRALLVRALALATAEVPWLGSLSVNANGSLEDLAGLHAQLPHAEFLEGKVVLLAQLLGLLVAFIGPTLTSRLVGEIWPQAMLEEDDFVKEAKK